MTIESVESAGDRLDDARDLFKAYAAELNENFCFQSFDEELSDPLKKYGGPQGSLFLAYEGAVAIGCIALQPLKQQGVCEMKRLYVVPAYRAAGVAAQLVDILLQSAKEKGYTKMVLDTLQRLQPAIRLYQKFGFVNTSAYYNNPLPTVVYMEKLL